jgi:hypothetical protein
MKKEILLVTIRPVFINPNSKYYSALALHQLSQFFIKPQYHFRQGFTFTIEEDF